MQVIAALPSSHCAARWHQGAVTCTGEETTWLPSPRQEETSVVAKGKQTPSASEAFPADAASLFHSIPFSLHFGKCSSTRQALTLYFPPDRVLCTEVVSDSIHE